MACDGWCVLKAIFSPFILLYYSFALYLAPCTVSYCRRAGRWVCCLACKCCRFQDKKFPPNDQSLGNLYAGHADWKRVQETTLRGNRHPTMLFPPRIRPSDVQQGSVGNCWLISAFACLAERPGTIQRCFRTREASARGKYTVRIYNRNTQKFEHVSVDDHVPCRKGSGQPLFAKPNAEEFWPLILEKAFAKWCGSYSALDGGVSAWAMEAMTGDKVFKFSRDRLGGEWHRYDLVSANNPRDKRDVRMRRKDEGYSADKLFDILWEYDRAEALIAASSEPGNDSTTDAVRGIVQGHAYSVLKIKKVSDFRMIQLRNPWGGFEWTGPWSDKSPLWKSHSKVAKELDHEDAAVDNGCFWMEMSDVVRHFKHFDVCDRTRGVNDLRLELHEEKGCCGPCYGCSAGCLKFWCLCRGGRRLICGHKSTGETREGRTCCICCGL
jgi:hypothetical protein